jgi:hypothetical protein
MCVRKASQIDPLGYANQLHLRCAGRRVIERHDIYKNVIHDVIGIEEAIQEIDSIIKKKPQYHKVIVRRPRRSDMLH